MANTFILKRSAVQGKVPTTGDLQLGELALNTYDGKLYAKKDNGTASIVRFGGTTDTALTFNNSGSGAASGTTFDGGTARTISYNSIGAPSTTGANASGTWGISISGSAATLTTGRTIGMTGDVTWTSASFNGSGNVTGTATLANSGVSAGTYTKITVDAKGRATSGTTLTAADIPAIGLEKLPDAWVKACVRAATTAAITLSGTQTIDGVALVAGDRVLVKNQAAPAANGIYVVAAGAWARAADADAPSELGGASVSVDSGTVNGGHVFDTDFKGTDVVGTSACNWFQAVDYNDLATTNTANKVVLRDGSGNFAAGTITAALSGNASTASAWATGRTIALTGDVTGTSAAWTGSGNISFATTIAAGVIVDADVNASAAIAGSKISPNFGSQAVSTTGTITGASLIPSSATVPVNGMFLPAANTVGLATGSTERLRITSTGAILAGSTSAVGDAYSPSGVRLFTLVGSSASFGAHRNDNTAFSNAFIFTKARGTGLETVQSGDTLGILTFQAANGTAFARAAGIEAYVDGTPSSTSMPGRLVFYTTPSGSTTPVERLKIESDGDVVVASNLQAPSINNGPLAGFRNLIVNGCFRVAQRGTSFNQVANLTYTLDRWVWETVNGAAVSIQQVTSVLNSSFVNALQLSVTTADTSIGTTEYAMIGQKIEGYNVLHLTSKTFTLSFWVASPKTGTHCVAFRNSGANRSYIATYTVNVANTLEYKTITVTNGLIVDGTWNWADGVGLNVSFVLACGSALHTTAGAWQTGNFLATSAQVNCLDNTANVFYLTCVQLEEGPVATPIERRSYGAELALCQRYYWRGQPASAYNYPAYAASSVGSWFTPFPVTMRATPTLNYNFTGATLSYCSVLSYGAATTQGARMNLLSSAATTNAYVSLTASNYFEATIEL